MGTDFSKRSIVCTLTATQYKKSEENIMCFAKRRVSIYPSTRHDIPEEFTLQQNGCENYKCSYRTLQPILLRHAETCVDHEQCQVFFVCNSSLNVCKLKHDALQICTFPLPRFNYDWNIKYYPT